MKTKQFLIMGILMSLVGCAGSRPDNLGISGDLLRDCPKKPNCVSTTSTSDKNKIDPISTSDSPVISMQKLTSIVQSMPGASIIEASTNYLRVEFKSSIFGFVDDVEFFQADGKSQISMRSASRMGYSDLGVNRKRMEQIRASYQ